MASIIKIKRSEVSGNPSSLGAGELAYSSLPDNGTNGGDRLYIGTGTEINGNAVNHVVIGGKYFTDMLSHPKGTLTANSAIIVDANSKINVLNVDNITIDENTISSTNTNGNILLDPAGSGSVQVVGTNAFVIPSGNISQRGPNLAGAIRYNTEISQFEGYSGTNWASLGGVRSVDGLTFIIAESSPGAGDDTLFFYVGDDSTTDGNKLAATLTKDSLHIFNETDADDTGTGALIVDGGVGIAKDVYIGGSLYTAGDNTLGDTTGDETTINGYLFVNLPDDNSSTSLDIYAGDNSYISIKTADDEEEVVFGSTPIVKILNNTDATGNGDGALVVTGGVDIGGALVVGGEFVGEGGASFQDINDTPIGNVTPSTGAFTSLEAETFQIVTDQGVPVYSLPTTDGTDGFVLTTDGDGSVTFVAPRPLNFTVGSTTVAAAPLTGGVTVTGNSTQGITPSISGSAGTPTINITAEDASTTQKGVASFNTNNFTVTSGAVSTKNITLGTSTLTNGSTTTDVAGLTSLEVDNIRIDGDVISAINGAEDNVNIVLTPKGAGTVDVSEAKITSVAFPTESTDAANKGYVDEVAQGLKARQAAWVLVDANLAATYDPDGHETGWATLTADVDGAFPEIDDVLSSELNVVGARILITGQTNAAHNGLYVLKTVGTESTPWVLRRCSSCYKSEQIPGSFVFVKLGTVYGNTGWVASVQDVTTFVIGVDPIDWIQFSGAGTFTAGDGLSLDGTVFSVNVPDNGEGGLEIVSDNVQIKSSLAGNGLSYNLGVLTVGGTANRITIDATSVDIASTYVGQTSITTLGTITTGTWQGTIVGPTYGGTGVNNGSSTITIGGNFTMSGAHTFTGTLTGNTTVTFPTTGTLATLTGTETISNKTITNSSIGSTNPSTAAFTSLDASGLVNFTNTTQASALGTAAVVLAGGLSVAKNTRVGGDLIGSGVETSNIEGFTIDGGTY